MTLSQPHVTAASPPPFPEAALRAVLAGTVAAWAQLPSAEDEPRRLYLDAFAGAEFQFGTGVERAGDEETRAGAAVRALEPVGAAPPVALFVEEDPAHLGRIYAELEDTAGGERLRATRDLASLAPGEVSLIETPFATVAAEVARFAAGARTFAFLAPPAARALPWDALRQVAALPDATVLIRLPHSDFEKQARHTGPLADLPGFARRIVEGCSAMLDDPRHAWLPAWRADAASGPSAAMAGVLERFRALLGGVASGRILRGMELETKGGARTWLFLLTPDPAVALAANAAVRAAKLVDHAPAAAPLAAASEAVADPPSTVSPSTAETVIDRAEISTADPSDTAPVPPRRKGRRASKSPDAAPSPAANASDASDAPEPALPPAAVDDAEASTSAPAPSNDLEPSEPPSDVAAPDAPEATASPATPEEAEPSPTVDAAAPGAAEAPAPPTAPARRASKPPAKPVAEVLDLFAEEVAEPEYVLAARPDPASIATDLEARFAGTTVGWGEIVRAFAADATPAELKTALAVLRRGGRAAYKALKSDDATIEFLAEPVAREKPKRRRKAEDDGGLFGGGDEDDGAGGKGD